MSILNYNSYNYLCQLIILLCNLNFQDDEVNKLAGKLGASQKESQRLSQLLQEQQK
jgi:hypothetical protein